jgi:hypothetical protein
MKILFTITLPPAKVRKHFAPGRQTHTAKKGKGSYKREK